MGARSKRDVAGEAWQLMARFTLEKFQRGGHLALLRAQGLTPGHLKALSVLDANEPRSMSALADAMSIDASQVTWLVDRLEERGLVERRTVPTDRRVKTIAITEEGLAFRRELMDEVFQPPEELLTLDAAQLAALLALLEELPAPSTNVWAR